jgi:hypothetical protein
MIKKIILILVSAFSFVCQNTEAEDVVLPRSCEFIRERLVPFYINHQKNEFFKLDIRRINEIKFFFTELLFQISKDQKKISSAILCDYVNQMIAINLGGEEIQTFKSKNCLLVDNQIVSPQLALDFKNSIINYLKTVPGYFSEIPLINTESKITMVEYFPERLVQNFSSTNQLEQIYKHKHALNSLNFIFAGKGIEDVALLINDPRYISDEIMRLRGNSNTLDKVIELLDQFEMRVTFRFQDKQNCETITELHVEFQDFKSDRNALFLTPAHCDSLKTHTYLSSYGELLRVDILTELKKAIQISSRFLRERQLKKIFEKYPLTHSNELDFYFAGKIVTYSQDPQNPCSKLSLYECTKVVSEVCGLYETIKENKSPLNTTSTKDVIKE